MKSKIFDCIIIGGGVVGCAIIRRLTLQGLHPILLEKGGDILSGASKANSAILHTGFDAPHNSLELDLVQEGYKEYLKIYKKFNLPMIKSGANVVAWDKDQMDSLESIVKKAHINNVKKVRVINKQKLLKNEPNISNLAFGAISVPDEYIIDSWSSPLAYLTQAVNHGAQYHFDTEVLSGNFKDGLWKIKTNKGIFNAKYIINAAGIYADKIQNICQKPSFTIKPRKGQFLVYEKALRKKLNSIILPVPTKRTKGVLLCETIYGNVILGPTAEEQDNRNEATVDNEGLKNLIIKGESIFPTLKNYKVTTTYAGLRTATEHSDYQIYATKEKNWICVAGIRSTGLTSSLGIATYVFNLLVENFAITTHAIKEKDIIWSKMPNLCDNYKRDYQNENSGEIICHCENVTKREVNAIFSSTIIPNNLQGIKRRTRAMMGACNGFNCSHRMNKIYNEKIKKNFDNQRTYDVIIIGSGPSALGIAVGLEKANKKYLILERESYIGGVPMTCDHHSFGLMTFARPMKGKTFIKKILKGLPLERFKINTSVLDINKEGKINARNTDGLITYKAKNIVLALGCRESQRHQRLVSGLRPKQIYTTGSIQRLIQANVKLDFKRPIIIGTEIVSYSALMSCFSKDVKPQAMIESSDNLKTFFALKLLNILKSVPIFYNAKITKIQNVDNVTSVEIQTSNQIKTIECDALIFTGKFIADNTLLYSSNLEKYISNDILQVDKEGGKIKDTNIWACGNILHPGLSGDSCFKEGKKLAKKIILNSQS